MLNLIHLNAQCMKEYTQMTHACMDQKDTMVFKKCETEANIFLQKCQDDKLRNLSDNDMNAHYFHMTAPSQWSAMGLAHHKWNLRKPADKAKWGKWEEEKPSKEEMHKWQNPFIDAKRQYGVDKWNMAIKPYDPVFDGHANVNIINVVRPEGEKSAQSFEDWKLDLLMKIETEQYFKVKEFLDKKKYMTPEQQKKFLLYIKKTDGEANKSVKKDTQEKKEAKPVEPKKDIVKPAVPEKKEEKKPADNKIADLFAQKGQL